MDRLYCDQCGEWIILVNAIHDRGEWWCAKHVQIYRWDNGKPIVDFPSEGKLAPRTIMHS